jgi:Fur family transcriptional regulator, ferric uptake regulator
MDQTLKAYLREHNQSVTPPRRWVFAYLQKHEQTTITELTTAATDFDRATIYRTLSLFRKLGIIHDLISGGRKLIELTDQFDAHHHHLTCTSCGKRLVIADPPIERRLDAIAELHGFAPTGHQIEVSGLCSDCRKKAVK